MSVATSLQQCVNIQGECRLSSNKSWLGCHVSWLLVEFLHHVGHVDGLYILV